MAAVAELGSLGYFARMTRDAAKVRVQVWVSERFRWASNVPQILDDETKEREFGWVFVFRLPDRPIPRRYEDFTGEEFPPVMVDSRDGRIEIWRNDDVA